MSMIVDPLSARPRGRSAFASLSAGMVLRGAVPEHVLHGPSCAVPPRLQALRDVPWPDPVPAMAPKPEPAPAPTPKAAPPTAKSNGKRRALTVRLDDVQHMRLRLVTTYLRRSAQDLFVSALDAYLDQLPSTVPGNCACMKAHRGTGPR